MIILKPGEPLPSVRESERNLLVHSNEQCLQNNANRIERQVSPVKRKADNNDKEVELSNSFKESLLLNGDVQSLNNTLRAPIELISEFLSSVMGKDYKNAQELCKKILEAEPDNKTCIEFQETLNIVLHNEQSSNESDEENESGDDDDCETGEESVDSDFNEESNSDSEESDNTGESEGESDEELPFEEINKLNLLVGGVTVRKETN